MVKVRFGAASFPRITGPPEHGTINELVRAIATVATGFKTCRCGGNTGCLALIIDQEEIRRVAKDDTLDCSRANDPTLLNPSIRDTNTARDEKILTTEHRVTWYEYYLEQALGLYGVATIVINIYHQYFAEKHEDYVGYANVTTRSMLEQLETHSTILDKEKLEIMAAFFAPWSDAPDMNLGDYARTLNKRQQ